MMKSVPSGAQSARLPAHSFVLPALALCLYIRESAPFLGQWDSFDYLQQIFLHRLSALGLGRPVFIGYNIFLWESLRRIFRLAPLQVEIVVMAGIVLTGFFGVLLFQRLARQVLMGRAVPMAVLALVSSPLYVIYSGFIMTEVPMLVTLIASASVLWEWKDRSSDARDIAGGILFGLAVGIREQALTLIAGFLWILWSRRPDRKSRLRSMLCFGFAAGLFILAPVFVNYLHDPAGFEARIQTWLHAIPMGQTQFWNNVQASALYAFAICPGAWLAAAGAGIYRILEGRSRNFDKDGLTQYDVLRGIPNPGWGILCCVAIPIVALWRDADVQIHPRYALVILPAALILCTSVYCRWIRTPKGYLLWAVLQVFALEVSLAAVAPFRQTQMQKMEFAKTIRNAVPGKALIIAGSYSPILEYYKCIGARPEWRVLWSGWSFDLKNAEAEIRNSWADNVPVYLNEGPASWPYLESEFLQYYFLLRDFRKEPVVPYLLRVFPERQEPGARIQKPE
jgi:hypothetical protein